MKRLITISIVLLGISQSFAQVGTHQLVSLKNGSQYKGILLRNANDTLQLLTEEDHILLFTKNEVLSVEPYRKSSVRYINSLENHKKWYSTTNFLVDFDALDQLGFGVESFFGIKHNKYFQNAIGFGFKQDFGWYNYEAFTAHISIQNRVNLRASGSTPFVSYEPAYIHMLNSGLQSDRYKNIGHSFEMGFRFFKPKNGHSFNVSAAVLRRVGEYFIIEYDPVIRGYTYKSLGWEPEYKMVVKLGWQL